MIQISIIVPTLNRPGILSETVAHLMKSIEGLSAEVIIVNDNSESPISSSDYIFSSLTVVHNSGKGAASARNYGAKLAKSDVLLFIDDDILVSQENILRTLFLSQLKSQNAFNLNWVYPPDIQKNLQNTSFGRFLIAHKLTNYRGWVRDVAWNDSEFVNVHKLAAFYFCIPKDLFFKVGGFHEGFSKQGVEDDEFSMRLSKIGVSMFIDQYHFVLHNELDKLSLEQRLERIKNGAKNRRKAFHMGMTEYEIKYSFLKKSLFKLLIPLKGSLLFFTRWIPNLKETDFIYFKMAEALFAIYIFEGYHEGHVS